MHTQIFIQKSIHLSYSIQGIEAMCCHISNLVLGAGEMAQKLRTIVAFAG